MTCNVDTCDDAFDYKSTRSSIAQCSEDITFCRPIGAITEVANTDILYSYAIEKSGRQLNCLLYGKLNCVILHDQSCMTIAQMHKRFFDFENSLMVFYRISKRLGFGKSTGCL